MYLKYFYAFPPEIHHPMPHSITPHSITIPFTLHVVAYKFPFFLCAFASALIFDYLSLGKGRYVLQRIHNDPRLAPMFKWVFADFLISLLISIVAFFALVFVLYMIWPNVLSNLTNVASATFADFVGSESWFMWRITKTGNLFATVFFSALLTSFWIFLSVVSAQMLRALGGSANAILQFIRWYFPMKTRPIEACGAGVAIIAWIVLVVYGVVFTFL
jgi:hypothetical protein